MESCSVEAAAGTLPELPQDTLMAIFATLEIPDLARAGSVCASWRSAYTSLRDLGQYKLTQTPCLLYTTPKFPGDRVVCLYSLADMRSYRLTLPEPPIRTRRWIGSLLGWLVTVDERSEMHLVNPITGQQVALPSVLTIEQVNPVFDEHGALHKYELSWHTGKRAGYKPPSIFALDKLRDKLHYKAHVFPDTSTGSYIAVLIHNPLRQLSFARVGDDKWTWLRPHEGFDDCTYMDGLLYAVTATGEFHAFDFSSGPVTCITIEMAIRIRSISDRGCMYIVPAPWGDLLLISRIFRDYVAEPDLGASAYWNTREYKVYEFDPSRSKLKELNCKELNCSCGHVLFLGHYKSLYLSAAEYPSLGANHLYFTEDNLLCALGIKNSYDMEIIDLDDDCMEEIVSPQSKRPAPIWITPDLRKMNLASEGFERKGLMGSVSQQRDAC